MGIKEGYLNKIISLFITAIILTRCAELHGASPIEELKTLDVFSSQIKTIRESIRSSIFIIKSGRDAVGLPELHFYRYTVKPGDSFWTILTATSQNIDTLMTVNSLATPNDIRPGKILYIPNMRGILYHTAKDDTLSSLSRKFNVGEPYLSRINKGAMSLNEYFFIPCGAVTTTERSMFLGTAFAHPILRGRLTSGFGLRKDPFLNRRSFHGGIDIACNTGTRVKAARDGIVEFTGYNGGYGLLVIIRHSHGYCTYYGHLSRAIVKRGDVVKTGDIIAHSGNTGRTTGPHLHFEARRGAQAINPGILLQQQ